MSQESKILIGLHGHAGVGKDTAADYIQDNYHVSATSFADPIRYAAEDLFGVDSHNFFFREAKETKNEYWNLSPREIMQRVGTIVRAEFGEDFFIKRAQYHLQQLDYNYNNNLFIDVRFQNEADWILKSGGYIIHLTREGYEGKVGIPNHISEQELELDSERLYVVTNNSTKEDLYDALDKVMYQILNAQIHI